MTNEAMSPLRRRMIEDMSVRRLAPKTQKDYIRRGADERDELAALHDSPASNAPNLSLAHGDHQVLVGRIRPHDIGYGGVRLCISWIRIE
jgi:hypothetical protein